MNAPAGHSVSLLRFASFLARRSVDVLEFFGRQGFTPNVFLLPDAWVPRDTCLALAGALATATGDPVAGAFLGAEIPVLEFGELGRAETLRGGCATMIRNVGLVHRGSWLAVRDEGDARVLRFSLEGSLRCEPRQFVLASLAVVRNMAMLAGEPQMVKVRLAMPCHRAYAAIEECFGANLEFGCGHDEVEIATETLDKPLGESSGPGRVDRALETTIGVALLVSARLPTDRVGIDGIGADLGIRRRTLQRRLADCGVAFSDLVDVIRRDVAMQRVLDGRGSLKALSLDLGYCDPAHFTARSGAGPAWHHPAICATREFPAEGANFRSCKRRLAVTQSSVPP